jgi:hypothetical protein
VMRLLYLHGDETALLPAFGLDNDRNEAGRDNMVGHLLNTERHKLNSRLLTLLLYRHIKSKTQVVKT